MIEINECMIVIIAMCITLMMSFLMALIDARFTTLGRLRILMPVATMLLFAGLIPTLKYFYSECVAMYCIIAITMIVAVITYYTLVFEDSKIKKK